MKAKSNKPKLATVEHNGEIYLTSKFVLKILGINRPELAEMCKRHGVVRHNISKDHTAANACYKISDIDKMTMIECGNY